MYTKNPQIRTSLLNYSHSSINLSFDVLDGLFRQCPIYFNILTARSCTIVLLLWKKIHFLKCCIFSESSNSCDAGSYFRIVSGLCGKVHGKTLCSVYCCSLAKFTEKNRSLNCQLISSSVTQIHSFCLVR